MESKQWSQVTPQIIHSGNSLFDLSYLMEHGDPITSLVWSQVEVSSSALRKDAVPIDLPVNTESPFIDICIGRWGGLSYFCRIHLSDCNYGESSITLMLNYYEAIQTLASKK